MTNAAITPLFEKLVDENLDIPFEKKIKRFSSSEELQASIIMDLSRLLNTRVAIFWQDYARKSGAIPFAYGINMTGVLSADSVFELQELEARIDAVIAQFEPRLINAKSSILNIGNDHASLYINIDATVIIENRRTLLSFPIILDMA
ncbi:MAG: type VI secretion system baseplate subunit TssE [Holosporaceae bacterium]|jgi:type VI secretion system lysozyme-like protein|nr:type VI secretion system baseplate subunit TssE [Holosporaceae bacterium]